MAASLIRWHSGVIAAVRKMMMSGRSKVTIVHGRTSGISASWELIKAKRYKKNSGEAEVCVGISKPYEKWRSDGEKLIQDYGCAGWVNLLELRCNDRERKFCCCHGSVFVERDKRNNGPDLRWPKGFKPLEGEVLRNGGIQKVPMDWSWESEVGLKTTT